MNCIRPGAIMTEMNERWMTDHPDWLASVMGGASTAASSGLTA